MPTKGAPLVNDMDFLHDVAYLIDKLNEFEETDIAALRKAENASDDCVNRCVALMENNTILMNVFVTLRLMQVIAQVARDAETESATQKLGAKGNA